MAASLYVALCAVGIFWLRALTVRLAAHFGKAFVDTADEGDMMVERSITELVRVLFGSDNDAWRDDAAQLLALSSDQAAAEAALLEAITSDAIDDSLKRTCAESLASIWVKRGFFEPHNLTRLTGMPRTVIEAFLVAAGTRPQVRSRISLAMETPVRAPLQSSHAGDGIVTTIRPSLFTSLIFTILGLVICLPGIDAVWLGQWQGMVFILVGGAITVAPISRYLISWNGDALVYRGLVATRRIRFSEVKKFDVHGPAGNRFGPTLGLRIFSVSADKPVMTINIKPFARRDIALLIEKLKEATG